MPVDLNTSSATRQRIDPAHVQGVEGEMPEAGVLPESLRVLCVCAREPSWVGLALQLDAVGCHAPRFHHVRTAAEGLMRLREEPLDVVIVVEPEPGPSQVAADAITVLRTAGVLTPIVVVRTQADDALTAAATRADVDVLISDRPWSTPALVPCVERAIGRAALVEEHRRLGFEHRRRLERDRCEAERVLLQQQRIIAGLHAPAVRTTEGDQAETPRGADADRRRNVQQELVGFYRELLRTHVIMGAGRLDGEIEQLVQMFVTADVGPREALELHLECVADLVRGLGTRSSRHVVARADLLALELIVQLGEALRIDPGRVPSV